MAARRRGVSDPEWVRRRMGLDRAEFLRSFPPAVAGLEWRVEGAVILVEDPPRRLEIHLGPEQTHRLGALSLPEMEVTLVFRGYSADEQAVFLRRFERAYQRGGG